MNISKVKLNDFNVYFRKGKINFPLLMEKVSDSEMKGKQLNAEDGSRSAHLVGYESKKFTVKNDREIDNRFEKKALNFISEPFYSHMIKQLACLAPEQRAYTADLYYAAEGYHFRRCIEVSTVYEYIDGEPLAGVNESNAEEVKGYIIKLHNADLASSDIHPGNFIKTPSGKLRIIDLSCKGIMKIYQTSNVLTFRDKYNIDIRGHGFAYNLISLRERLHRLSRKVRGR